MIYLRKEIEMKMSHIPEFIKTTSELHHKLWMNMMSCNDVILILVVTRILKDKSIIEIAQKFDDFIIDVLCVDAKLHFDIAVYFTDMLDYILDRCIEEEEYEAATNLRVFNELYYQNMTPYPDDTDN